MSTSSKNTIYALLVGFGLFIAGGAGLLWVDNRRIERHTDELNDLRIHLNGRDQDVDKLRRQLRACCPDSTVLLKPPTSETPQKTPTSHGWDH
ncbi:hypothetical protein [Fibrella aquatica]|uniref:hypothetical protein n=1 Tax=Fibrella aquatica TaxID=3242487 RepID=UPI003520E59F